ncbi:undecaprenyl-diphosphate phosphatase [Caulobacter sp. KR2-114]|uniref:undecaprenyl-diphosphate phosphatase n=1 Tax=Caulobacter sp. KR2-114 TaxID=3400912 RepID=UPI003C01B844
MPDWLTAIVLGIVEGLTEFIPVSSTGHLLLTQTLLERLGLMHGNWDAFTVMIQLGAILAVVLLYFQRLLLVALRLPSDPKSRRFVLSVLIAFIPAGIMGFLFHHMIEGFFSNPRLICITLIVGGVILWVVDRWHPAPRHTDAMRYPLLTSLGIGLFQCLSLVPGVSRSGSTIVGATLLGCDRRSSAEFSFFLAIPIMIGAFSLDAWKHRHDLTGGQTELIAIGFVVSFLVGMVVVRVLLDYVSKRGFTFFAIWRIVVGAAGLALLTWAGK